jgi:hypothetical protein
MIELFQVFIQFIIFNILFLCPITPYFAFNLLNIKNYTYYNILIINILVHLLIYLIISLFIKNLTTIFLFLIFFSIFVLFINFKSNFLFIKNNFNKLFLTFFILNISLSLKSIVEPNLYWDGVSHWIYKASAYYQGLGFVNTGIKEYPHLPGFIWAFFWKNSLLQHEYIGRLFLIFFYITSIFSILDFFKVYIKDIVKILFVFLVIFLSYEKNLFGGYNEYYIFCLITVSLKFLYLMFFNKKINYKEFFFYKKLFYLSTYLLIWIKQEGIFWFLILTIILIYFEQSKKNKFIHIIYLFFSLISYYLIKNFLYETVNFSYEFYNVNYLTDFSFFKILKSALSISYYLLISFLKYPIWILVILFFLKSSFEKNFLKKYRIFYLFFFLSIIFLYSLMIHFTFTTNNEAAIDLVLRVSFDRIILQSAGFYLIFMIIVFNKHFAPFFKKK